MSQTAMELLRLETELDFWPLMNGRTHQVSATGCPHGPPSPPQHTPAQPSTPMVVTNATHSILHEDKGLKGNERKTMPGYSRTPHNYYECCINVHVSALLDHWLDWDRPPVSQREVPKDSSTHIEELISHLATMADPIPRVREFCSNIGCDVLNRPDEEGRTLLHHLLSGKLKTSLPEMCTVLLEAGADPKAIDAEGNSPLLQVRHLLDAGLYHQAQEVATILINNYGSNVNSVNKKDRTLLSYSVAHFDKSITLSRFLINAGATILPDKKDATNAANSTIDLLDRERNMSAFVWFLKGLMSQDHLGLDGAYDTLYLLCAVMGEQPVRMRQHVHRTMMQLGKSRSLNGPLFRQVHTEMIPYWARPQDLRYIALRSVRKSLGPKRLSNGSAISRLGLPKKLQDYVELRHCPPRSDGITTPPSFHSQPSEDIEAITYHHFKSTEQRDNNV